MFEKRPDLLEIAGGILIAAMFGILFAIILIEWMAGCGETTWIDAETEVQNECVIMTWHND